MDKLLSKISKVATLALRPGTPGEGAAAEGTLLALCRKAGAECGWGANGAIESALMGAGIGSNPALWGAAWNAYCDGIA